MSSSARTHNGRRPGPRPLPLHLGMASCTLAGAVAGLPAARAGLIPWHPDLSSRAQQIHADMQDHALPQLLTAVMGEADKRLKQTITGIETYQTHPHCRQARDPEPCFRMGQAKLLDYAPDRPGDRAVLFVPSLINRHYVLDLEEDNSLMRWLARHGIRPFLVDWGDPGPLERHYDTGDYVLGPLCHAIEHICELTGQPALPVVGYCMGGTLVTAAAQLMPDRVRALGLMAAPWDFQADLSKPAEQFAKLSAMWLPVVRQLGEMPVDLIQAFFAALDPNLAQRKFARFATMPPDGAAAKQFVALEDWLNDGIALAAPTAEDCFNGWYGENRTMTGKWTIRGTVIDPARIGVPAFCAIPANDRIVPPASARGLADRLIKVQVETPRAGHIGMVVGSRAYENLWRPLRHWIETIL